MGQQPCCESMMGKKSLFNQNEPNTYTKEYNAESAAITSNQNTNQLKATPNYTTNLGNSTNSNLNPNQLMAPNLTASQNGISLGNSVRSLKLNESINNSTLSMGNTFTCIKTFEAHDEKIVALIELSSGYIATGSYDCTIRIWDVNTQRCLKVIQEYGHVLCLLEFEPNFILSGTDNNTIQLWDINNPKKELFSFEKHLLWVNCLVKCDDEYFASGSNDSDIVIWSYPERNCVNVLKGHSNCVLTMIKLNDGNLCSGSADFTIKIWDWANGTCLNTLNGHTRWVKSVYQLSNGYILSGSDDKTIKVWNDYTLIKELVGHTRSVRSFCQLNNNLFASASFDKTIKIWDINTLRLVQTLEGHKHNVICIIVHKATGSFISCSADHTIKIWKK